MNRSQAAALAGTPAPARFEVLEQGSRTGVALGVVRGTAAQHGLQPVGQRLDLDPLRGEGSAAQQAATSPRAARSSAGSASPSGARRRGQVRPASPARPRHTA